MIYNMDCISGSKEILEDNSVDLLIADPPYNLGFGGTTQTRTKKPRFSIIVNDQLSHRDYLTFTFQWLREAYRVLKPGRHIYVCIDWRMYPYIALWLRKVGFVIKNCIVWDKEKIGMGWQYRFQHEFMVFAIKPDRKVRQIRSRSVSDVWRIPRIPGNKTIHPTEKPVELMERIIENSTVIGELVADFFSGSGSVLEAALLKERRIIAFEIDTTWWEVSNQRFKRMKR